MATRLYNEGKYMEAMNKMSANFNIISLKNHMDPNYYKKILQQKIAQQFQKKKNAVSSLDEMRD